MSIQPSTTSAQSSSSVNRLATKKVPNPKSAATLKASNIGKALQTAASIEASKSGTPLQVSTQISSLETKPTENKAHLASVSSGIKAPSEKSKSIAEQDIEKAREKFLKLNSKNTSKKMERVSKNAQKLTENKSPPKPLAQKQGAPVKKVTFDSRNLKKFGKISSVPVDIRTANQSRNISQSHSSSSHQNAKLDTSHPPIQDHKDNKHSFKKSSAPPQQKQVSGQVSSLPFRTRPELLKQNSELSEEVWNLREENTELKKTYANLLRTIKSSVIQSNPDDSDQGDDDTLAFSKRAVNKALVRLEQ